MTSYLLWAIPFKNVEGGGGSGNQFKMCIIGGLMIIQNALIGGFSFNRSALGGGSYQIRGIQNVGGGGGGYI